MLEKITDNQISTYGVVAAPDKLTGTATENKKVFDRLVREIVSVQYNALVDALTAATGAGEIGSTVSGLEGETVQAILTALKALRDSDVSSQSAANTSVQTALENRYTKDQTDAKLALKFDTATANSLVKSISFNGDTGVFTITTQGGSVSTIDTLLEKVPATFSLEGNKLVLTLEDGTKQEADLSAFIDTYTFSDSATVGFSQTGKTVSAQVLDGSVTLAKLDSTAQSTLAGYADRAEAAESGAETAQTAAEAAKATAQSAATTATTKAGEASASQQAAQNAKTAAETAKAAAAASAATAAESETAAAASADAAASSQSAAAASKADAAASAAAAAASEQNALASKNAAAASQTSAANSAATAQTAQSAASASATAAATAKTAAEAARDAAQASAESIGTAAEDAAASATQAESYAKGGTGSRTGEATDNAKYYCEQAREYKEQAGEIVGGDFATKSEAQGYAATAKNEAIAAAATDAATKANAAEANAKAASLPLTQKGAAGGVAELDSSGKVPTAQLPAMNYDPAGSAAVVQTNLNTHTGNADIHVTAADKTAWNGKPTKAEAQGYAATAKEEAVEAAAGDAATKANAAEANAKAASLPLTQKGAAGGVAELDSSGKVPTAQLPAMNYDPAGSAAAVQTNLDTHTGSTAVHVTTAEKTAWNGKAPAYSYGTTDLTAGSSELATGVLYFVYE